MFFLVLSVVAFAVSFLGFRGGLIWMIRQGVVTSRVEWICVSQRCQGSSGEGVKRNTNLRRLLSWFLKAFVRGRSTERVRLLWRRAGRIIDS